jgi:hypothetical protein
MVYEYKVTVSKIPSMQYMVTVWQRTTGDHEEKGAWTRIAGYKTYTHEGHFSSRERLRLILRDLARSA